MKKLWLSLGLVAGLAGWVGSAPSLRAQATGTIAGAISGPTGPIAGLTVNVVNAAGSVAGTAVTMPAGTYTIGNLAVGTYTIQVVNPARRVVGTGVATVTAGAAATTVDLTLTASQLAGAAVAAGAGAGMSTATKVILASAAAAAAGVAGVVATRDDSSPTR
jgi:Carboxypeptidase regulatory-like domain